MHDLEYPRVAHAFFNTPWAIMPEKLEEMRLFIEAKVRGEAPPPTPAAALRPDYQVIGRTAVIPIMGVLSQRMDMMTAISGGTSTEGIGRKLDAAMADRSVRNIALWIGSPGGSVFGIEELGRKIAEARGEKKVVAAIDPIGASAAYWLASQAQQIYITPSGQAGSVGVIVPHTDLSKANEQAGVKTTLIHAGKFKAEADPSQPLTDDARQNLQYMVDSYYAMFVKAVAKGRGVTETRVENHFGQGRMKLAKDAVESGMADGVATFAQVLSKLGATDGNSAAVAMRVTDAIAKAVRP